MRKTFILLFCLIVSLSFAVKLKHADWRNLAYNTQPNSFAMHNLDLEKPTKIQIKKYDFVNKKSRVREFDYDGNKILISYNSSKNKVMASVHNHGLKETFKFNFEENLPEYMPDDKFTISFNPTSDKNSKDKLSLSLADDGNYVCFRRNDVRVGTVTFSDDEYKIYLKSSTLDFSRGTLYIDKNCNNELDTESGLDVNNHVKSEAISTIDNFYIGDKLYGIKSISNDGYDIEFEEKIPEKIMSINNYIPDFKYFDGKNKKKFDPNGVITVIYNWSPACSGSIAGVPAFNKLYSEYFDNEKVNIMPFTNYSEKELRKTKLKDLMGNDLNLDFKSYCDSDLSDNFFGAFNTLIIVDQNGIIKYHGGCSMSFRSNENGEDTNYTKIKSYIDQLSR